jgi:hypothetical protein
MGETELLGGYSQQGHLLSKGLSHSQWVRGASGRGDTYPSRGLHWICGHLSASQELGSLWLWGQVAVNDQGG